MELVSTSCGCSLGAVWPWINSCLLGSTRCCGDYLLSFYYVSTTLNSRMLVLLLCVV